MYDSLFCRLYDDFGWNEYPRVLGGQLLDWLSLRGPLPRTALDLGCGTGVLCEVLSAGGIETLGVDLSEEMIAIARRRAPHLRYEVGNMVTYRPQQAVDLITCTGDALNHLFDPEDVRGTFGNAFSALREGGIFVFDLLRPDEIPDGEPFEAAYGEGRRVRFLTQADASGHIRLQIDMLRGDALEFSEVILEKVHPIDDVLCWLRQAGFVVLQWGDRLLPGGRERGTTWFIVAGKPPVQPGVPEG